jgi:glutamyl/glutaminyl-tRNA synthetase
VRSRLAPTPSGLLHEGNALNFILTWWFTRFHGGELLLRIDDSDDSRVRDEFLDDIFRVIDWLGIDYDLGPRGVDDHKANFSQPSKKEYYYYELQKFLGSELFGCACSRKELEGYKSYPGFCLNKGLTFEKERTSLRFKKNFLGEFNQMILWRKDDAPAYQLVSVLEDRDSAITHIVRGQDLLQSTKFQKELYINFSSLTFPLSFHHELIVNENNEKLSKKQKAGGVRDKYKSCHEFLEKVLWPYLGQSYEGIGLEELVKTPPGENIFREAF